MRDCRVDRGRIRLEIREANARSTSGTYTNRLQRIGEAVADDEQATAYVAMLEREYDQRAEEAIPSADDLGADFERFLRDQRDEED